ncbi:MAG TPA: F420H2 dehydrogenase [Candidatus Methanoperedenaceae archaeon]|nr:F420H2 dehydrogenase [Candidatus Methanoperedenaceae archaeon]
MPKIGDVIKYNYCSSCGTCEAVCPLGVVAVSREPVKNVQEKGSYQKAYVLTEGDHEGKDCAQQVCMSCVNCYSCERVCPILDGFPDDEFDNIRFMKAGKSQMPGQDGGIVSQIIKSLLEKGEIDCAIGTTRNEKWETEVVLMTRPEEVAPTGGTKYTYKPVVARTRSLVRDYSYYPSIPPKEVRSALEKFEKVAIVGVPCQVHGSSLLRSNLSGKIKLIIGLICMESFSYEVMSQVMIPKIMGLDITSVNKMNFHKGKFTARTAAETKEVPIKEVAPLARAGCHHCLDYTSYYSDICVGSVGSPDGWSTIIVRTETGEKYLNMAGGIEYSDKPIDDAIIRKLAAQKHKHNDWDWRAFLRQKWMDEKQPQRGWSKPVMPWAMDKIERALQKPPVKAEPEPKPPQAKAGATG